MKASAPGILAPRLPKPLPAGSFGRLQDEAQLNTFLSSSEDLSGQTAKDVLFEQVMVRKGSFLQTVFPALRVFDSRLDHCDLSGAQWEKTRLRRCELLGCRLLGTQWLEASLEDVLLRDCNCEGALFLNMLCKSVRFERCNLREVSFEEANLAEVVFQDCDLSRTILRKAKLKGADLRTSILDELQTGPLELQGAIISPLQAAQVVGLMGVIVRNIDEPD